MQTRSRDVTVLAFDDVDLLDIAGPVEVLSTAGRHWNWRPFRIHVAASEPLVRTSSQLVLQAATTLEACPMSEVIIVPGGYGTRKLSEDVRVMGWLRDRTRHADIVVCIGDGALLLARAGVLTTETISAPPSIHGLIRESAPGIVLHAGATFFGERVQSARSGTHAAELGLSAVARLLGPKVAGTLAAQLDLPWTADTPPDAVPEVLIRSAGDPENSNGE